MFLFLAAAVLAGAGAAQRPEVARTRALPEGAPAALALVDRDDLLRHAAYLASDELAGRYTGTSGQARAARYVAEHFEKLGLEPLGDPSEDGSRSYFQRYTVERLSVDAAASELVVGEERFARGYAVLPGGLAARSVALAGPWVLEGPGRDEEAPSLGERIPLVLLRTPALHADRPELEFMAAFQALARVRGTVRKLGARGASVVVFATLDDDAGLASVLNYIALHPDKPLVRKGRAGGMASMGRMVVGGGADAPLLVFLSAAVSERLLGRFGLDDQETRARYFGAEREEVLAAARPVEGSLRLELAFEPEAEVENVVAVLRGADPELAEEAIVFSAHMDHMGVRMDGRIFHGADDNASGTAGLLEIAEAFARGPDRPRRSIVFLSVSGEEEGLWGSAHFAAHPTWPLEKIVANVNSDMIGRNGPESGPDEVTATPSYRHPAYSTLGRTAAELGPRLGLTLSVGDKYYQRSDHYHFARRGVPVVFFCDGEHEDYHRVTDVAGKLEGDKMERIARLAFWTGYRAAMSDARPRRLGRHTDWLGEPRARRKSGRTPEKASASAGKRAVKESGGEKIKIP